MRVPGNFFGGGAVISRGKNFLKKFPRTCSQAIISFVSKTSAKTFSKKQLHGTSEELNLSGETTGRKTSEGLSFCRTMFFIYSINAC